MNKKGLHIIVLLLIIVVFTGCDKVKDIKKSSNKEFMITCTSKKSAISGIETQSITTYNFNKDQYLTSYSVTTTQKFSDKKTYETYRDDQNEVIKNSDEEDIVNVLEEDEEKKTLVSTMTVNNIDVSKRTEEKKNTAKASTILKSNEEHGLTCELSGVTKDELK